MRRDLDLVRTILKTCADASGPVDVHAFTDDAHSFELVAYQLHTVAAWCGYRLEQHHHALADAEACAWIARQII